MDMATAAPAGLTVGSARAKQRPAHRHWHKLMNWLHSDSTQQWIKRKAVAMWMNVLIAAVVIVTVVSAGFLAQQEWPEQSTWGAGALKLFVVWCLSFLPGWLYVRFLGLRAAALWSDYVLTLHRLGWDRPWYLPEPPRSSEFYQPWSSKAQTGASPAGNVYLQKFEAYYGRQIPARSARKAPNIDGSTGDYIVRTESLFPMFLATAVLATGWSATLWDTTFLTAPSGIWDMLKYGFLGAYAFVVSMLVRRFFQSDLRPSAYATAVLRIMLVLLIVAVLYQVVDATSPAAIGGELALAFLIGFFPLAGLQILQRVASKLFRVVVPPLTSDYPLDQLDGLNLWYEARLTEEGVEDMQNLTTMNMVDIILHTRVPPGRLVDWIDQAFLLIHLDSADRRAMRKTRKEGATAPTGDGAAARVALRRVGIRTATDLLKAFSVEESGPCGPLQTRRYDPASSSSVQLAPGQLSLLVKVLSAEPGLAPVWNWQRNGVVAHATIRPESLVDSSTPGHSDGAVSGEVPAA